MHYEFVLTHGQFAKAWLAEYYLAAKSGPFRLFGGPFMAALGWQLHRMFRGSPMAVLGSVAIGFGVYYTLKPFLQIALKLRYRHRFGAHKTKTEVTLDDDGIEIRSGKAEVSLGWDRIARAGKRPHYVWFETDKSTRGTIPRTAIDDLPALEQLFRDKGKWS